MNGIIICPKTHMFVRLLGWCEKVSQHFREYRVFIEHLSETNDNRLFLQGEPNLCIDPDYFGRCTVFDNFMKTVTKFAKNKGR